MFIYQQNIIWGHQEHIAKSEWEFEDMSFGVEFSFKDVCFDIEIGALTLIEHWIPTIFKLLKTFVMPHL